MPFQTLGDQESSLDKGNGWSRLQKNLWFFQLTESFCPAAIGCGEGSVVQTTKCAAAVLLRSLRLQPLPEKVTDRQTVHLGKHR